MWVPRTRRLFVFLPTCFIHYTSWKGFLNNQFHVYFSRLIGIQLGNSFMLFLQFQIASFCLPSFLPALPFIAFCEAFEAEKCETEKIESARYSDSVKKLTKETKGVKGLPTNRNCFDICSLIKLLDLMVRWKILSQKLYRWLKLHWSLTFSGFHFSAAQATLCLIKTKSITVFTPVNIHPEATALSPNRLWQ